MAQRKAKKGVSFAALFGYALFFALVAYMLTSLISTQVVISAKKQELEVTQNQLASYTESVEELQRLLKGSPEEIIEQVARDDYDYAAPNERIFVDVSND